MDVFYEESSVPSYAKKGERKYKIINAFSMIALCIGCFLGFLCFMFIGASIAWFFGFQTAFFLGIWFLLRKWKSGVNVSFDYIFVSGELRISKVINVNRRKLVAKIEIGIFL